MSNLQSIIEQAFEDRMNITPKTVSAEIKQSVLDALAALNDGSARVAEKIAGEWVVHQWLKKAVLLSFRIWDNEVIDGAESTFFDKVPMKYTNYTQTDFEADGVRVVPEHQYVRVVLSVKMLWLCQALLILAPLLMKVVWLMHGQL